jgi:hypothetical protein
MQDEQLQGDAISADSSQLNQEIGREEGQGSWDQFETEPEENATSEIEAGQETEEDIEPETTGKDAEEDEVETEQKNTPQGEPNRVLSFKDFFSKD